MSDFLIVGGGVIGLLLARELSGAGAEVTLLEQGECCREASWAGGGIVSPLYPWRYTPAVTALARYAQLAYPPLVQQLLAETGIDPELGRTGLLMLDADDEAQALQWARASGSVMQLVDADFFRSREPLLGTHFKSGLWMPEIANIRNPRLGQALLQSLRQQPRVQIREHTEVVALESDAQGSRIRQVVVRNAGVRESLRTRQVIVCAGAWSGSLLESVGVELPVQPVKGQMLLFRTERRLLDTIVLTAGRYLIPRRDNHILVGSTLEYTRFDKSTTVEARTSLLDSALQLLPALAGYPVQMQWSGLRPGAPEGIPFIGRVPGFSNLHVNAGHHRNGLVLAPASATLMADLLLGRPCVVDPVPYMPGSRRD